LFDLVLVPIANTSAVYDLEKDDVQTLWKATIELLMLIQHLIAQAAYIFFKTGKNCIAQSHELGLILIDNFSKKFDLL